MRILLASPHFPPSRIGGVEFYTKRLADFLQASGDAPEVMCAERIDADVATPHAVLDTTHGYPVHRLSFNLSAAADRFQATYHSAFVEQWTADLLDRRRPDVVHLHSGYLMGGAVIAAAVSRKIPTVVTLHDFWFVCPRVTLLHPDGKRCSGPETPAKCAWCLATSQRRFRLPNAATGGRLGRAAVRLLASPAIASATGWADDVAAVRGRMSALRDALMRADLVLSPSRFLRDLIAQSGVPADRVTLSRYGIDVPATPVPRKAAERPGLRIGYLGQVAPHKGVGVLIHALRHLPGAALELRVFGNLASHGRYGDELREMARQDARVTFPGPYRHEQVYGILAELDVVVVPSVWYENAPFVIQEAQAAHVPVLASRLGGMRELVADETDGLLFEPGDARDLARQLRRLLEEPGLLQRLRPDGTSVRTEDDEMRELTAHYRHLACRS